jgi:hypothetical protein
MQKQEKSKQLLPNQKWSGTPMKTIKENAKNTLKKVLESLVVGKLAAR